MLEKVGLSQYTRAFLADPDTALQSVIAAWSWQQIALAMVIFLAGLTSVPKELTEAAEIDGAGYWRTVRHVVVPLLRPAAVVVIALSVINSLKVPNPLHARRPFHSSTTSR